MGGELEGLLRSLSQYLPRALALVCGQTEPATRTWKLGPVLVFERLWQRLGRRGKLKDHRPDPPQRMVGVVLDQGGQPRCSHLWPGNTADVKSLVPVARDLQRRFGVGRICVVANRERISTETIR